MDLLRLEFEGHSNTDISQNFRLLTKKLKDFDIGIFQPQNM